MNFVKGGDFHVSDHYTINHDKDNLIKFTPKQEGTIKILIQQPQTEVDLDDDSFDIEIALYDQQK